MSVSVVEFREFTELRSQTQMTNEETGDRDYNCRRDERMAQLATAGGREQHGDWRRRSGRVTASKPLADSSTRASIVGLHRVSME